jgi:hypothetical protein
MRRSKRQEERHPWHPLLLKPSSRHAHVFQRQTEHAARISQTLRRTGLTRESSATIDDATVIAWSGKILPHSPNGWLAVIRGSLLVPGADEFKEHAGFGRVSGDVGEVIQDQQVVFVELGNRGFEKEFATRATHLDCRAAHQQLVERAGAAYALFGTATGDARQRPSAAYRAKQDAPVDDHINMVDGIYYEFSRSSSKQCVSCQP